MSKLKPLFGTDAIAIFKKFGFEIHSQKGSHIKLRRITPLGKETLTIPNHRELATGTCQALFRQATRYILESELFPYFYD
jgi:predicted RNA binding protein YcfA (HicA-like mRNA interferase family)